MPTFIDINGAQVETGFTHDARTTMTCPACTHLIPDITPQQLTIDPVTSAAAWIDCACQRGEGASVFAVPHLDCPCYARFRVQYAAGNRYNVVAVDYATMEQKRQEREAAEQAEQRWEVVTSALLDAHATDDEAAAQAELDRITARVQADEPTGYLFSNGGPDWSPEKIKEFETYYNRILAGNSPLKPENLPPGWQFVPVSTPQADAEPDEESLVALRDAEEPTPTEAEAVVFTVTGQDQYGNSVTDSITQADIENAQPLMEMLKEGKAEAVITSIEPAPAPAKPKAKRTAKK